MYIKIKHIKNTLLIVMCLFFGLVNYFTYVKADNDIKSCNKTIDKDCDGLADSEEVSFGTDVENSDSDGDGYSDGVEIKSGFNPLKAAPGDKIIPDSVESEKFAVSNQKESLTDELIDKLGSYVEENGTSVSTANVQALIDEVIVDKSGGALNWQVLPAIDETKIKKIDQSYTDLKEEDKKEKIRRDAASYIIKISYLLVNNAPEQMLSDDDIKPMAEKFLLNYSSLSSPNPDYKYFEDISNRFGRFADEVEQLEVPETMIPLHIKIVRWSRGFSTLPQFFPSDKRDPIANILVVSKITAYINLMAEFFDNDVKVYINSKK